MSSTKIIGFLNKNVNEITVDESEIDINLEIVDVNTQNILNETITEEQTKKAITLLKNNKASGIDNIINEHIKSTADLMIPLYTKLFNIRLDDSIFPIEWSVGVIKPILKHKGSRAKPDNYRSITLYITHYCFKHTVQSIHRRK